MLRAVVCRVIFSLKIHGTFSVHALLIKGAGEKLAWLILLGIAWICLIKRFEE